MGRLDSNARSPLQRFRDCKRCPEMVVIPSGSFMMGSPPDEEARASDEGPPRRVQVRSFAMGCTAVSFSEYDRFAKVTGRDRPSDEGWGRRAYPAINVSWDDANDYAQWLSTQTGQRYRLPSEAEWEYAARAGTTGPFSFVGMISSAKANYNSHYSYGDSQREFSGYREQTVPVGSLPANPWGLYEVHGNVLEWVADCWHSDYADAPSNGGVWAGGNCGRRVLRGGCWLNGPGGLRSADRVHAMPTSRYPFVGFRLARDL